MNTPLIVLCALVALGLVVAVLDALPFGAETYTINTRNLPNTVADHRSDTSREVRS